MLERARSFLARKGLEASRLEAELLVAHALGLRRLDLFLTLDRPVTGVEVDRARELLVRRSGGEPTAYLVGEREFYGRPFAVGPGVLVPRPETELIVDRARERRAGAQATRAVDLGTGSGCLAITLALELPGAKVAGVDASREALGYAARNARELGADVRWWEGDAFEVLRRRGVEDLDLLVCNPPYVGRDERDRLAPEVRDHEPPEALFAPEGDPDHWVRRLLEEGLAHLAAGGVLLVELAPGQGERWIERARAGAAEARLVPDLAGVDRVLEVTR